MTHLRKTAACAAAALLAACGGGSNTRSATPTPTPPQTTQSGIAVPTEISALPASSATGGGAALRARLASLPATSDYALAPSVKYVDEQALDQFSTFNTIFKALGQSHYADPENLGHGPYGCMVDWDDKGGSSTGKQIIPWVVDSRMTTDASGKAENQVKVWMQQNMGDGQPHLIKVVLDIYEAPTQLPDGSYADYGVWNINAKFDESATGYFAASCRRDANGHSVIALHEVDPGGGKGGQARETKGILNRSDSEGYGAVSYPDQDCPNGVCPPGNVTASYAYDASHVALQAGSDPVVFKDRTAAVDVVNRYGLYDATTGADVTKTHSFGFPIKYVDDAGLQHWGYYGAWQGRHQLGYDGMNAIPAGKTVTRADLPPNAPAQSFTVSDAFAGTLVKRTLVPGDIQGIKDVVVQTWVNKNFGLGFDGTHWLTCPPGSWVNLNGIPANPGVPACSNGPSSSLGAPTPFDDFGSLVLNPHDLQQQVMISYNPPPPACQTFPCPPPQPTQPQMLVYVAGVGFFHTDSTQPMGGPMTQPVSNGIPFVPALGDQLFVNIGGPIYISYDGRGFVKKTVASQNQNSFMPNFVDGGDVPFTLDPSFEYYFNTPGVNYVVRSAGGGYDVKVELQYVANPVNAGSFVPARTVFRQQWDNSTCSATCGSQSTYRFDAGAMKLVYVCVGSQDQNASGKSAGDEVTTPQWGLLAYDASCTNTHVQYNWDYPQGQQQGSFGTQQFLTRGDGSYVILEDPIRLASIQLPNHAGTVMTLSLQFDGNWVNGLPDIYNALSNNGWVLSQAIADKVVIIPAGTEVVDASDATKHYVFKPLQMNEYLPVIDDPGDVSVAPATALDLSTVPTFVDGHLGSLPSVPVKYSEGNLVQ